MDLEVIYSKTAKGLRARASLIGGISAHMMRILSLVDGTSKAKSILSKYDLLTETQLATALSQLEKDGYIKPVVITRPGDDDWALTQNFAPMEVEEVLSVEETEARAKEAARIAEEHKAKIKEETRLQAERKAKEKEEQEQAKEKVKAEAKIKALLETERKVKEIEDARQKAEAEAKAKADEKARINAERKAKAEEEARQKAEEKALTEEQARQGAEAKLEVERKAREVLEAKLEAERKAREEAEQAHAKAEADRKKAEADAKEEARREIERIAREAEESQKKVEAETRAKIEEARLSAEQKAKAEAETKLDAERKARQAAEATLEAERKAKADEEAKKAEAEELRKAELKQKEEAERKARAEEEAKKAEAARLEKEQKAKAEAEKAAQLEAERRAKAEAEEKNKENEKERARQEIARIVREAEEARKTTEAKAKEERQEALRKAKAEEEAKKAAEKARVKAEQEAKQQAKLEARRGPKTVQARLKAETQAKEVIEPLEVEAQVQIPITVEAKADISANEKASLLMESFALNIEGQEEAQALEQFEEDVTIEAKRKAKADTETEYIRAKVDAEEQAKAQARELAQMEMQRIAKEAELERQKQDAEQRKVAVTQTKPATQSQPSNSANAIEVRWGGDLESDDDEPFDDEEENLVEEENKVKREIEKKNKHGAEVQGREDIKRQAKLEAAIKEKSKNSRKIINHSKWISKLKKVVFLYLPLLILLLIGLLHVINISPLIAPIEKLASESMGEAVKIGEVHASLWPQPHLVLGNVAIGSSNQNIQAVNVVPDTSTLSEAVKRVKLIEIEGLVLGQESFSQPQQWVNSLSKAQHMKVAQIDLKKIAFKLRELELGPFAGKVELDESKQLKNIHLISADNTLSLQITPQGDSADIALTGTNWPLPVNSKVVFDEVKATGKASQSLIYFSQFEGKIYGGNFTGKAAIDWSSEWSLAGNFDLTKATLPRMLKAFGSSASIDGKLNLAGIFSYKSAVAAKLTDAPELKASFEVLDGKINGVELVQAVMSKTNQSLAGEATRFDTLTGNLQISNGLYEYKQLALNTDQFHARGNVDIAPNQDISGRISADLAAESRRLQASFDLAGKVGAVQRQ